MSDQQLGQSVVEELEFDPRIDASNICVRAEKGVVTLMGHVSSFKEKIAAGVGALLAAAVQLSSANADK